ncbi:DUF6716 putative glycosyltransferase [Agromyces aerolatus]|uniref:DUF6716 putative glycosyltransferase n=1 Tax=Agromyces sp. LY-1074 TaxID=3074080 RepID=UPI00285C3AC6|nr:MULTISPECIES: DUF6716 putative glycosyltransferase [unclassified Agromyces]MDR5698265.1 hypothetical protein [Agromyces sp. LY-1074]MDR5704559.1 hypothetical protein [Agromyces sp. LY-1358]
MTGAAAPGAHAAAGAHTAPGAHAAAGATRRLLVLSDSDSYTKWGATLAASLPEGWHSELALLDTDVMPSPRQLSVAVAGTRWADVPPRRVALDGLVAFVGEVHPDAVLLAFRGPLVRVTAGLLQALPDRPVLIAGFPGLTIPAVPKAIIYREQVDLVVLHSRREVREFTRLAADLPAAPRFGLATLPFLPGRGADASGRVRPDGDVVFAVQAKVPATREERVHLVGVLAAAARRQPRRRFVVKVRAQAGEAQTHAESYDLGELVRDPDVARELGCTLPPNLLVEDGPMSAHLARAAALVTVSSTAVLEAIAAGVPALLLDDYGIGPRQLNVVFEGSGLFGDGEALAAGAWRQPDPGWLDDNYFHGAAADDWVDRLESLLAARAAAPLPVLTRHHNRTGGALRRAFERRKMLGSHDRTLAGRASMLVAVPVRGVVRAVRRLRTRLTGAAAVDPSQPVHEARTAERAMR